MLHYTETQQSFVSRLRKSRGHFLLQGWRFGIFLHIFFCIILYIMFYLYVCVCMYLCVCVCVAKLEQFTLAVWEAQMGWDPNWEIPFKGLGTLLLWYSRGLRLPHDCRDASFSRTAVRLIIVFFSVISARWMSLLKFKITTRCEFFRYHFTYFQNGISMKSVAIILLIYKTVFPWSFSVSFYLFTRRYFYEVFRYHFTHS